MRTTNVEFVTDLMEHNSPLMQVFIINAIQGMAEMTASAEKPENFPELLHWEAWQECAKIAVQKIEERYETS